MNKPQSYRMADPEIGEECEMYKVSEIDKYLKYRRIQSMIETWAVRRKLAKYWVDYWQRRAEIYGPTTPHEFDFKGRAAVPMSNSVKHTPIQWYNKWLCVSILCREKVFAAKQALSILTAE